MRVGKYMRQAMRSPIRSLKAARAERAIVSWVAQFTKHWALAHTTTARPLELRSYDWHNGKLSKGKFKEMQSRATACSDYCGLL